VPDTGIGPAIHCKNELARLFKPQRAARSVSLIVNTTQSRITAIINISGVSASAAVLFERCEYCCVPNDYARFMGNSSDA
jgi:hypothetical protein